MRSPEQAVAALAVRHPDWAILFGRFSHDFVAFPRWAGYAHRGMITAKNPGELERAMAHVEAASGRTAASVPSHGPAFS